MSVTCAVCRKQPIPFDRSRSFFQFPKTTNLRLQWMEILGLEVVKSTWRVCSDHFSPSAFHEQSGYNNRRRNLLSTALPNRSNTSARLSNISNTCCGNVVQRIPFVNKQNIQSSQFLKSYNSTGDDELTKQSDKAMQMHTVSSEHHVQTDNNRQMVLTTLPNCSNVSCKNTVQRIPLANEKSNISSSYQCLKECNGTYGNNVTSSSSEAMEIETYVSDCNNIGRACSSTREEGSPTANSELHSSQTSIAIVDYNEDVQNTSDIERTISKASLKRKHDDTDAYVVRTKKFRFKHGSTIECISRADFASDEAWGKFLRSTICKDNLVRAHRKRNLRKDKKIGSFKELLNTLKEEQHSSITQYLEELPAHMKELICRMKNKIRTDAFPAHLKNFARTLHFYSPAAYEMVRESFMKCLPCIESLNNWDRCKDYEPGIDNESIDSVSEIVSKESQKGKKLVFNVTFDEMGIKKWTKYCNKSHEWKGLVDLGGQLEEVGKNGQGLPASKALAFMLVNINGGFKMPVAYYLLNSLTGIEKSILLKDLLVKLHEKRIDVVSVSFDGDDSNQKTCKELGANFDYTHEENFKPYFTHPAALKPVYVFFDPCHMLKLIRNYFAQKGPLIYDDEKFIKWEFISNLNDIQYNEGIHCACKIKNRHVYFQNEKMKVYLAAQVLSNSTSAALTLLEERLKNQNFKGASSTAEFCKIFNDIFDVLNAKNLYCKTPGRKAVTRTTLTELKKKIDGWISYIEKLKVDIKVRSKQQNENKENHANVKEIFNFVRKSVISAPEVRTGFVGFIIRLKNLNDLCDSLFKDEVIDYFLSYKICQDHVEMFFALIRGMNGFCNNPTTVQFKSAYKKLVKNKLNVTVSRSANCTPQDKTFLISDDNETLCKDANQSEKNSDNRQKKPRKRCAKLTKNQRFPVRMYLHTDYSIQEHDYVDWVASEYQEQVIGHVAGAVVYSIKRLIHCEQCLDMLKGSMSGKSCLTELKNRGGLNFASDDVILICQSAEKLLRRFKDCLLTKDIHHKLVTETLKVLPPRILDYNNHILEQERLYDHRHQLIYLIVQNYVDKRLKHEGDKLCDVKDRIRMHYNKLTIFKG